MEPPTLPTPAGLAAEVLAATGCSAADAVRVARMLRDLGAHDVPHRGRRLAMARQCARHLAELRELAADPSRAADDPEWSLADFEALCDRYLGET